MRPPNPSYCHQPTSRPWQELSLAASTDIPKGYSLPIPNPYSLSQCPLTSVDSKLTMIMNLILIHFLYKPESFSLATRHPSPVRCTLESSWPISVPKQTSRVALPAVLQPSSPLTVSNCPETSAPPMPAPQARCPLQERVDLSPGNTGPLALQAPPAGPGSPNTCHRDTQPAT